MTTIRRWWNVLAVGGLMLIIAGEGSLGEVLVDMSVEIYTARPDAIQHFLGDRFSAGGRNGLLGTFTVTEVTPPDCGNTALSLAADLSSGFFVAYSEPAQFASLQLAPSLHQAVVTSLETDIRAAGGIGEIVPYAIWRFTLEHGASTLVFATIRTPNFRDETWGAPGGFDAIALMQLNGKDLIVLDKTIWLATTDGLSMDIDVMAVARNPATGASELYLRYRSFEYNEYVGYDISDGKLRPILHSECSM